MRSAIVQCGGVRIIECGLYGKGTARTVRNAEYGVHNRGSYLYMCIMDVRLGPSGAVRSVEVSAIGSVC